MRRLALLLLLLLALPGLAPPTARAQGPITLAASAAQPDFPNQITFSMAAASAAAEIESVQLLYGSARGEGLTVVELPVEPAPQVELSHTLDTRVYYSPPGTELSFRWVVRDSAGNSLTSEPQRFFYHDERFPWSERSERNVTLYWYRGGPAFGDEMMDVTIRTLDQLQREIGADLDQPVRIYIYGSNADMRSALESNSVEWVGGQAWPGLGVIIGAIEPGNSPEVERLIPHELSHQVLHQATENPYGGTPVWFDEGLAVHYQLRRDAGWDEMVRDAARAGRLIPLEALAAGFPADPDQALLSYAQSRDIVEFIIASYGADKLRGLVQAFAAATPADEALPQVLGVTVDELDAAWRATMPAPAALPTPASGPASAPPERFAEDPVLPEGVPAPAPLPGAPDMAGQPGGIVAWIERQPAALTLGAAALCCVVGVGLLGAALLFVLRLIGVDKQA